MKISLKSLVRLHEEEVKDSDIPFLLKPDEDEEKNKPKQPVVPDVPSLVDVVGKIATNSNTPAAPAATPTQKPAASATTPATTPAAQGPYPDSPNRQKLLDKWNDALARANAPVPPPETPDSIKADLDRQDRDSADKKIQTAFKDGYKDVREIQFTPEEQANMAAEAKRMGTTVDVIRAQRINDATNPKNKPLTPEETAADVTRNAARKAAADRLKRHRYETATAGQGANAIPFEKWETWMEKGTSDDAQHHRVRGQIVLSGKDPKTLSKEDIQRLYDADTENQNRIKESEKERFAADAVKAKTDLTKKWQETLKQDADESGNVKVTLKNGRVIVVNKREDGQLDIENLSDPDARSLFAHVKDRAAETERQARKEARRNQKTNAPTNTSAPTAAGTAASGGASSGGGSSGSAPSGGASSGGGSSGRSGGPRASSGGSSRSDSGMGAFAPSTGSAAPSTRVASAASASGGVSLQNTGVSASVPTAKVSAGGGMMAAKKVGMSPEQQMELLRLNLDSEKNKSKTSTEIGGNFGMMMASAGESDTNKAIKPLAPKGAKKAIGVRGSRGYESQVVDIGLAEGVRFRRGELLMMNEMIMTPAQSSVQTPGKKGVMGILDPANKSSGGIDTAIGVLATPPSMRLPQAMIDTGFTKKNKKRIIDFYSSGPGMAAGIAALASHGAFSKSALGAKTLQMLKGSAGGKLTNLVDLVGSRTKSGPNPSLGPAIKKLTGMAGNLVDQETLEKRAGRELGAILIDTRLRSQEI